MAGIMILYVDQTFPSPSSQEMSPLDLLLFLRPDQQAFPANTRPQAQSCHVYTTRNLYIDPTLSPLCKGEGAHLNRGSMRGIVMINGKHPHGVLLRKGR